LISFFCVDVKQLAFNSPNPLPTNQTLHICRDNNVKLPVIARVKPAYI